MHMTFVHTKNQIIVDDAQINYYYLIVLSRADTDAVTGGESDCIIYHWEFFVWGGNEQKKKNSSATHR